MVQSDLHSTTDVFSRSIIDTRRVWRNCASENFLSDCWTAEVCWGRNLLRSGMDIAADNVQLQLAAAYACQGLWMTVIIEVVTQVHCLPCTHVHQHNASAPALPSLRDL